MKLNVFISLVSKHTAQIVMLLISKCLTQMNAEHILFCIGYGFIFLKFNFDDRLCWCSLI